MRLHRARPSAKASLAVGLITLTALLVAVTVGRASAASSDTKASSITIGVLYAFTGPNAQNGTTGMAGCLAGVTAVNAEGGVLGTTLKCQPFDTKGDPADAVPATNQMLASASNLAMVIGPSDEAPATIPITNAAKIPNFATVGDPRQDTNTDAYFYRLTPSDSVQGYALGYFGAKYGYKHSASVFTSDLGAQTSVPTFKARFKQLGGKVVADLTLAPGKSSYRTEVEKVINSHPNAIFTEMDPQTAATFLSEYQQLNNNKLPLIVSTQRANQPDFITAVRKAIGVAAFKKSVWTVAPYVEATGLGFQTYRKTILGLNGKVKDAQSYVGHPYSTADYDGIVISALAMTEAKSSKGSDYNKFIPGITSAKKGATIVRTYAQGVAAIKAGKKITYIGASGVLAFNRYHSAPREFALYKYDSKTGNMDSVKVFPGAALLPK